LYEPVTAGVVIWAASFGTDEFARPLSLARILFNRSRTTSNRSTTPSGTRPATGSW
jgi:hypothetical protein